MSIFKKPHTSEPTVTKTKKKLLPKNFGTLLEKGDLAELQAVFGACDVNARGGFVEQTAVAFDDCPDTLVHWLVAQGADLSATDTRGNTPLHARSRGWREGRIGVLLDLGADVNVGNASMETPLHLAAGAHRVESVSRLVDHGANVDARTAEGLTPLELALQNCTNATLERMTRLAEILLRAGASETPRMKVFVERIGTAFEHHRTAFNSEMVEATSNALMRLYALFEVPAVPQRRSHDGKTPIVVTAPRWQQQHEELWELLVPSSGPATTIQGEVVRISGRIGDELHRNGGLNWDADYKAMAAAFLNHVGSGHPLSSSELSEAADIVAAVKRKSADATVRMAQLAVTWVLLNPMPVGLPPPPYKR